MKETDMSSAPQIRTKRSAVKPYAILFGGIGVVAVGFHYLDAWVDARQEKALNTQNAAALETFSRGP
jgi:hypothetical protein